MIKVRKLVPEVYYNDSRDFQLLGRTFEVLYNYLKTNAELVKVGSTAEYNDTFLVQLLALTLGFKTKGEYNNRSLREVCSVFSYILKDKGSIKSIEEAVNIVLHALDISSDKSYIYKDINEPSNIEIYLPSKIKELDELHLLEDILDYILPVGTTYSFKFLSGDRTELTDGIPNDRFVDEINWLTSTQNKLARVAKYGVIEPDFDTSSIDDDLGIIYYSSVPTKNGLEEGEPNNE